MAHALAVAARVAVCAALCAPLCALSAAIVPVADALVRASRELPPSASDDTPPEPALMGVRVNDIDQPGTILALRLPGRAIAVPVAALAAWHVRLPALKTLWIDGADYVALGSIPGARWREEAASQTLVLQLPASAFLHNEFEVTNQVVSAPVVARFGGFVNYDLQWQRSSAPLGGGSQFANGLLEAGVFNAQGNGTVSGVLRSSGGAPCFTRLDTTWNIDMPSSLTSVRLGDAIGVAGAWGRAVRYGGVQWATNFAVQPGLVSFPMPAIRGEATVPSVVDLYINNTRQLQGKVPAGAFDLPDVPVVTGQGQIRMVVRDLLGREQVIVQPYYVSPTLLRPGLRDFAVDGGTLREDYGLAGEHYGRAFVSATDRVGVSDEFTRELRVELLRAQQTVGITGVWQVLKRATLNASAVASHDPAGNGWLAAAGVDHQDARWSASAQLRLSSRGFAALGDGARVTAPQRAALTAGVAAAVGESSVAVTLLQQSNWGGDAYRSLGISHGRNIGRLGYVSLFATRTLGSASGTTVGINLITLLGGDASASVGSYRSRDRVPGAAGSPDTTSALHQNTVQLQDNMPAGPGFGYQITGERGSFDRFSAEGTAQGEHGAVSAGVAGSGGTEAYRVGLKGAVALMPEGIYFGRRIDGSFAVVQVGDYAGVRVNRDNQTVARTNAQGQAFVGGLRGFESNQISVEPGDLPLDAQVDQLKIAVAPGARSGVSVVFPLRRTRSATLRLVTVDGQPVPAGVSVRVEGDAHDYPVGFDGRLFLAGLGNANRISAQWSEQRCTAEIALDPAPDDVPELGTQVCR